MDYAWIRLPSGTVISTRKLCAFHANENNGYFVFDEGHHIVCSKEDAEAFKAVRFNCFLVPALPAEIKEAEKKETEAKV